MQENHFSDTHAQHCENHLLEQFLENINAAHQCSTSTCFDSWHYIACLALFSLQKPCHHFIWTQLFSPLAPSVMTFLFQPEQRSHSPFSNCSWAENSSHQEGCHVTHSASLLPYLPPLFALHLKWKKKWALYFLTWHGYLTQLMSHMLLPGQHWFNAHCLHSALLWLFCNVGHLGIEACIPIAVIVSNWGVR